MVDVTNRQSPSTADVRRVWAAAAGRCTLCNPPSSRTRSLVSRSRSENSPITWVLRPPHHGATRNSAVVSEPGTRTCCWCVATATAPSTMVASSADGLLKNCVNASAFTRPGSADSRRSVPIGRRICSAWSAPSAEASPNSHPQRSLRRRRVPGFTPSGYPAATRLTLTLTSELTATPGPKRTSRRSCHGSRTLRRLFTREYATMR